MVEAEEMVEGVEDEADKIENIQEDEGIVEEKDKLKEEKGESTYDDETEEVDGMFEPCTKTEFGGQLHKMMILQAGYKLAE